MAEKCILVTFQQIQKVGLCSASLQTDWFHRRLILMLNISMLNANLNISEYQRICSTHCQLRNEYLNFIFNLKLDLLMFSILSQRTMNSNNLPTLRIEITNAPMYSPFADTMQMDSVYWENESPPLKMPRQMEILTEHSSRKPMKIRPFNGYDWVTSSGLMPAQWNFSWTVLNAANLGNFDWECSIFVISFNTTSL